VVVCGARRNAPHITASRFDDEGGLEEFVPSEPLDPTALPFLHPLQHAVDALSALQGQQGREAGDPADPLGLRDSPGTGSLPLHPG
jgi:hypothetical protein